MSSRTCLHLDNYGFKYLCILDWVCRLEKHNISGSLHCWDDEDKLWDSRVCLTSEVFSYMQLKNNYIIKINYRRYHAIMHIKEDSTYLTEPPKQTPTSNQKWKEYAYHMLGIDICKKSLKTKNILLQNKKYFTTKQKLQFVL